MSYPYAMSFMEAWERCLEEGGRPKVVCLCGSTRFKREFIEANYRETMAGNIVLSVGWFSHADAEVYSPTEKEKAGLDALHLEKVRLADEVLVINVGQYIGQSTANEIEHARRLGKPIRWWEDELARTRPETPAPAGA